MNSPATASPTSLEKPTRVRYGVLGFACSLSMITYLDRVCFGAVAGNIQDEFGLTDWQKGLLFSAFALAYAAFEIPTGWLGDKFGARKTLIRIVLWSSIFTVLTGVIHPTPAWPLLAFLAMLVVRFLFGVGEAGAYPNIARAFHNWFPFTERGFVKGAVWMAGRFAGGITPLIVFALIQETVENVDGQVVKTAHWRHIFWIFGIVGSAWCIFFWLWFRDRPEQKAGVNQAEIALIHAGEAHSTTPFQVPWGALVRDRNLWALCLMYFMGAFGWYFNISFLPGYIKSSFAVQPAKWSWDFWIASLMSGMPLLMGSMACLLGGVFSDMFIRSTGNRKWGRRLFGVVGHGLGALFFFSAIFVDGVWSVVMALSLAAFCNDLTMGASWASCLDIGGKYSGIVAGCMNSIGNLGGTVAGLLTGWILSLYTAELTQYTPLYREAEAQGWRLNFALFGAAYVIAMILWCFFDSTKPVQGAKD